MDIEDISWPDRSIRLHGKGDRPREMFFSRAVGTLLDKYLATRGNPMSGPLFVTHRKARQPRRADLDADGYARLSYRQADTLWKRYTPDWDLHQLRHTAISVRAAHDYTEVDLKRFSGHSSLRSLERYIADNREAAKRKAREWERRLFALHLHRRRKDQIGSEIRLNWQRAQILVVIRPLPCQDTSAGRWREACHRALACVSVRASARHV
jgi:hypothetical protein